MTETQLTQQLRARYMLLALVLGIVLMGAKFLAYELTGSAAIFSDALESIVNVCAAGFGLWAVRVSAQEPDAQHPYGHGKVEFLAAGFEGGLILMAGAGIWFQAWRALQVHEQLDRLDIGMGIIGLTLVANLLLGWALIRAGKKHHSAAVEADGRHLVVDSASSAGLLAGLILIYFTGWTWADPAIAAILGGWVIWHGIKLIREALGGLLDESDDALLKQTATILSAARRKSWVDLHNLRIVKHGADIHIDCHITLPRYLPLDPIHDEVKAVELLLKDQLAGTGRRLEIFIHADPCLPPCCPNCEQPDCPVRTAPFTTHLNWTQERLIQNQKHSMQSGDD